MTLATYAHRGAYPLLATALLAGAFALAARPWLAERPMLKPLLLLWLAQNTLLTLSALYRLDLYVDAFGLTYLRAHAAIWMALVAAGLALTLTQIALQRSNLWLLIRCTVLGAATLYTCAFINFAAIIVQVNVAEEKFDLYYLCDLGPTAAAELAHAPYWVRSHCLANQPQITGWRDWGFRNWASFIPCRDRRRCMKILVVDDDPRLRDLVSLTLTRAGYSVITAANGALALTHAFAKPPT